MHWAVHSDRAGCLVMTIVGARCVGDGGKGHSEGRGGRMNIRKVDWLLCTVCVCPCVCGCVRA